MGLCAYGCLFYLQLEMLGIWKAVTMARSGEGVKYRRQLIRVKSQQHVSPP